MAVKTATTVDPFDDARQRHAAGVFGMWLFLVMLAMLFGATILGYLVVRVNADPMEPFVPDDAPALPHLLLVSTVALLASSYTMHRTVRAVRQGVQVAAARMAGATLLLAIAFLLLQAWAWLDLWRQNVRTSWMPCGCCSTPRCGSARSPGSGRRLVEREAREVQARHRDQRRAVARAEQHRGR